jgi:hypothetical protein
MEIYYNKDYIIRRFIIGADHNYDISLYYLLSYKYIRSVITGRPIIN